MMPLLINLTLTRNFFLFRGRLAGTGGHLGLPIECSYIGITVYRFTAIISRNTGITLQNDISVIPVLFLILVIKDLYRY